MADNKERIIGEENLQTEKVAGGLIELRENSANVPREVESWLKKIERDPTVIKKVIDDSGQVVPVANTSAQTQLPVSRGKFLAGFKKSVNDTGRWLSVFLLRIIKKESGNVKFNEE
jgi:hypothetical protein